MEKYGLVLEGGGMRGASGKGVSCRNHPVCGKRAGTPEKGLGRKKHAGGKFPGKLPVFPRAGGFRAEAFGAGHPSAGLPELSGALRGGFPDCGAHR